MAAVGNADEAPAGPLKLSMGQAFGRNFVLPLLGDFLSRYPRVVPDLHFVNRQVDMVGEGFDAAIGGGFALAPGIIARELAPVHIVAVASPRYMVGRTPPRGPGDMASFDGFMRRSTPTDEYAHGHWALGAWTSKRSSAGRGSSSVTPRPLRRRRGWASALQYSPRHSRSLRSNPVNSCGSFRAGTATRGRCRCTYPTKRLLPAKTRVFVDFILERFRSADFARLVASVR